MTCQKHRPINIFIVIAMTLMFSATTMALLDSNIIVKDYNNKVRIIDPVNDQLEETLPDTLGTYNFPVYSNGEIMLVNSSGYLKRYDPTTYTKIGEEYLGGTYTGCTYWNSTDYACLKQKGELEMYPSGATYDLSGEDYLNIDVNYVEAGMTNIQKIDKDTALISIYAEVDANEDTATQGMIMAQLEDLTLSQTYGGETAIARKNDLNDGEGSAFGYYTGGKIYAGHYSIRSDDKENMRLDVDSDYIYQSKDYTDNLPPSDNTDTEHVTIANNQDTAIYIKDNKVCEEDHLDGDKRCTEVHSNTLSTIKYAVPYGETTITTSPTSANYSSYDTGKDNPETTLKPSLVRFHDMEIHWSGGLWENTGIGSGEVVEQGDDRKLWLEQNSEMVYDTNYPVYLDSLFSWEDTLPKQDIFIDSGDTGRNYYFEWEQTNDIGLVFHQKGGSNFMEITSYPSCTYDTGNCFANNTEQAIMNFEEDITIDQVYVYTKDNEAYFDDIQIYSEDEITMSKTDAKWEDVRFFNNYDTDNYNDQTKYWKTIRKGMLPEIMTFEVNNGGTLTTTANYSNLMILYDDNQYYYHSDWDGEGHVVEDNYYVDPMPSRPFPKDPEDDEIRIRPELQDTRIGTSGDTVYYWSGTSTHNDNDGTVTAYNNRMKMDTESQRKVNNEWLHTFKIGSIYEQSIYGINIAGEDITCKYTNPAGDTYTYNKNEQDNDYLFNKEIYGVDESETYTVSCTGQGFEDYTKDKRLQPESNFNIYCTDLYYKTSISGTKLDTDKPRLYVDAVLPDTENAEERYTARLTVDSTGETYNPRNSYVNKYMGVLYTFAPPIQNDSFSYTATVVDEDTGSREYCYAGVGADINAPTITDISMTTNKEHAQNYLDRKHNLYLKLNDTLNNNVTEITTTVYGGEQSIAGINSGDLSLIKLADSFQIAGYGFNTDTGDTYKEITKSAGGTGISELNTTINTAPMELQMWTYADIYFMALNYGDTYRSMQELYEGGRYGVSHIDIEIEYESPETNGTGEIYYTYSSTFAPEEKTVYIDGARFPSSLYYANYTKGQVTTNMNLNLLLPEGYVEQGLKQGIDKYMPLTWIQRDFLGFIVFIMMVVIFAPIYIHMAKR